MFYMPDEDEYWERRREEYERLPKDWKPEPERKILCLDNEIDNLEAEYGCSLEELYEGDLYDIVFRLKGEEPLKAEYDPAYLAIFYEIEAA